MTSTFHLEDKVTYLFGDAPQYKVVATKEQPYVRDAADIILPKEFDYLIIRWPLVVGAINAYIPVREAHIELSR